MLNTTIMIKKQLKKTTFWSLLKDYKWYFILCFGLIFALIFTATYIFDMVPIELQVQTGSERIDSSFAVSEFGYGQPVEVIPDSSAKPTRVIIEKVGINSVIEHPQSQEVSALDTALQKGAVYYPGSGSFSKGNILLFGHSTNHPVVINQAYKTFNRLNELVSGDKITIMGDDQKSYIYEVKTVNTLDDDKALVEFNTGKRTLTLSTCNTFGKKQERHVVIAEFVEVI